VGEAYEGFGSVLVGVPGPDLSFTETRGAMRQMIVPNGEWRELPGQRSEYARTKLISYFMRETKHDWLFLLDSDMRPEKDTLLKLLQHQKGMIGALYLYRGQPPFPCVREDYNPYTIEDWPSQPFFDFPKDAVFKVGAIGFGAMLIHRDVLEVVEPLRWSAAMPIGLDGPLAWAYYGPWRGKLGGGDLVFCDLCKLAGVDIWCDSSAVVPHLTSDYVKLEEYDADMARQSVKDGKRG